MNEGQSDGPSELGDGDLVRVPDHVLIQETDGESVLLNLETELYLGLNESGTTMFNELRRTGSVRAAHRALCAIYDIDERRLRRELDDFVEELRRQGLIEGVDSPGGNDDA